VVQKLLPLLEGNIAATVANILAPQPKTAPSPPPIDLSPVQQSIAELQTQHRNLRDQVSEQNACLNRVQDHLEAVREATDRNTLEQQELLDDLKSMGRKVNLVAAIAIGLLAISLLVNLALFMHIQRVLP
jgi:septal ring factor EnvC (AmiA/AmiB activator)